MCVWEGGGGGRGRGKTLVHLPLHIALSFSETTNSALNKTMCQWLAEVGNGLVVEAENGLVVEVNKKGLVTQRKRLGAVQNGANTP